MVKARTKNKFLIIYEPTMQMENKLRTQSEHQTVVNLEGIPEETSVTEPQIVRQRGKVTSF